MIDSTAVITILLVVLCFMASIDLWKQYVIRDNSYWFKQYSIASQSSYDFWKFGYRLEDLELKLKAEEDFYSNFIKVIDQSSNKLRKNSDHVISHRETKVVDSREFRYNIANLIHNTTSFYQIRCETTGNLLRVGVNDFRTDSRDDCQIFTSSTNSQIGPGSYFEIVPLPEGAIGLRSIANGYFVKAVGPPNDNKYAPWKLMIGGPNAGAAERFRLTKDSLLFSSVAGTTLLS